MADVVKQIESVSMLLSEAYEAGAADGRVVVAEQDAEIARLRAEVERLERVRDAAEDYCQLGINSLRDRLRAALDAAKSGGA